MGNFKNQLSRGTLGQFLLYWGRITLRAGCVATKAVNVREQALQGCALSLVILVISYGALDIIVSHTFLESVKGNALYNLVLIVPSAIVVWLIYFLWNLIYQPVAWHYEIAPSGEDVVIREYRSPDNKKVGIRIDNPSDHKITDVLVMLKSLTRIWIGSGLRSGEQIDQGNLQFTRGAYFDESKPVEIAPHRHIIIYIAEDRDGAPVFLIKDEIPHITLEKLTERTPVVGGEDIVHEREVAVWEIELEIDGFATTGTLSTKTFKSNVIFEKMTWTDLFRGKPEIDSGIYLGVSIDVKEADQKASTAPKE